MSAIAMPAHARSNCARAGTWAILTAHERREHHGSVLVTRARPAAVVVDEACLVGEHNSLDTVSEIELRQDVGDVCLDRPFAEDISARPPGWTARGDQPEHVPFARRERWTSRRCARVAGEARSTGL